jgi:hypothetical protein
VQAKTKSKGEIDTMKKMAILATAVAGMLVLVSSDEASLAPERVQPHKGPAPIVHRSPAIGGGVPRPVEVRPPPVVVHPPPVVVHAPAVVNRAPAIVAPPRPPVHVDVPVKPVVKQPVNAFVNNNINKFAGPEEKHPVTKEVVVRPKVVEKPALNVIDAYHKKLGNAPLKVGGRVIDMKRRDDLVANYQKHWQERVDGRFDRARLIRNDLGHRFDNLFAPHWWDNFHNVHVGWWGRWPGFAAAWYDAFTLRNHWGWWRWAPWETFTGWCFPGVWGPPLYYDYGGNVIFDNNVVYVDGSPVASEADYGAQAQALAASGADWLAQNPPSPDGIDQNWLPLGVWGLTNQDQGDPSMFVQVAVNKNGVLLGTFTNTLTNEALPVVGAIDPNTQRAAWFVGDNKDVVYDTGAYNLAQSETQVLVHFGLDKTQAWLMVRMPEPTQ